MINAKAECSSKFRGERRLAGSGRQVHSVRLGERCGPSGTAVNGKQDSRVLDEKEAWLSRITGLSANARTARRKKIIMKIKK